MKRAEAFLRIRSAAQRKGSFLYGELAMDEGVVNAHADSSGPGDYVELHTHPFFEIVFVERGQIEYILSAARYQVGPGDLIIIPPHVGHRPIIPQGTASYDRLVAWVAEGFARSVGSYARVAEEMLRRPRILRTAEAGASDQFRAMMDRIVREDDRKGEGWELAIGANAVLLLVEMRRFSERGKVRPAMSADTLLDQLLLYIERSFSSSVTARDAARALLVSESAIEKVMRERLGTSFHRYVTTRRLIEAKTLMLRGESITRAAALAGFADYSTFYRAFRRAYAVSPREFLEAYHQ